MYQELGLLCVLFLPVLLIYFYRSNALDDDNHDNSNRATTTSTTKKSKKSKKKKGKGKASLDSNSSKTTTTDKQSLPITTTTTATTDTSHSQQKDSKRSPSLGKQSTPSLDAQTSPLMDRAPEASNELTTKASTKSDGTSKEKKESFAAAATAAADKANEPSREVDKHMDLTARYSRVMRITTEPEEEEWEPVPYEDGWESIDSSKKPIYSAPRTQEVASKKQRENQAKAAKRKEAKAAADALQAERLRRHQKELERRKINEFYSTGAGKNTPWGKKGQKGTSSKTPTATAGLNEKGQLIWD
ncbi:hypothetical protein BDB00DRAFT_870594 [Zychaea mexicana]|uniref:uncharacterized protein n=1 Tax=Zychaea mexicana TaxID=64656 RepID=UPI0022FE6148|nr:uncharacterized protein BDB00DRAFT_870594 [Zychaea mexicana]KAI9495140.1 hypothetical protein BDB00DRAFT_870594 [Zychaea mexicana]